MKRTWLVLSLEWKSEGLMDAQNGDEDKDGLTSEWGGESRQDWWVMRLMMKWIWKLIQGIALSDRWEYSVQECLSPRCCRDVSSELAECCRERLWSHGALSAQPSNTVAQEISVEDNYYNPRFPSHNKNIDTVIKSWSPQPCFHEKRVVVRLHFMQIDSSNECYQLATVVVCWQHQWSDAKIKHVANTWILVKIPIVGPTAHETGHVLQGWKWYHVPGIVFPIHVYLPRLQYIVLFYRYKL